MGENLFTAWNNHTLEDGTYAIHFYRDQGDHGEKSRVFHSNSYLTTGVVKMNELKSYFAKMKFLHNYQVSTFQRFVLYKDQKLVKMHRCYFKDSKFYLEGDGKWYELANPNKMIRLINSFDKISYQWPNLVDAPAYQYLK